MKKIIWSAIGLGLFTALIGVLIVYFFRIPISIFSGSSPTIAIVSSETSTQPKFLHIPILELTAPVVALGLNETGEFAAPNQGYEVGWYLASGYPGSTNHDPAILLSGHLTDQNGRPGVFTNLHRLQVGGQFQLERHDGAIFNYTIAEMTILPLAEVDMTTLMTSIASEQEGVSIITCAGNYDQVLATYQQRLIVRAVIDK